MTIHNLNRKLTNIIALTLATFAAISAFLFLILVMLSLLSKGLPGLNWHILFAITRSPSGNGGLLNPIIGSLIMNLMAIILGGIIGIGVGTYLAEYQPTSKFSTITRFLLDILLGTPAIIIGLFIYQIYVVRVHHFSGWAGTFALSLLVIPIISRTTEHNYMLVPGILRESVLALGASNWKLVSFLLFRVIRGGVITGLLLAFARIIGEAAPLLFTALNNQFWNINMNKPMANLPTTIFNYSMSPYSSWQQLAWSGALIITIWVLIINLVGRFIVRQSLHQNK